MVLAGILSLTLLGFAAAARGSTQKPLQQLARGASLRAAPFWGNPTTNNIRLDAPEVYDAGLFTPLGDLSAVLTTTYTVLEHPLFPHHSVRIKKSNFCDGTVP